MKIFILDTLNELFNESILHDQVKWEKTNKKIAGIGTKLKHFKKNGNHIDNIDYKVCKLQLDDAIYKEKSKGIKKIRSKCN